MPRWARYWVLCAITYATPVALVVASNPLAYNWWLNWLIVAGPPVVLGLGLWLWNR